MTLKQFIKQHKKEIDKTILEKRRVLGGRINNAEREFWIGYDEELFSLAMEYGIKV
jgi:hypothetical protein